VAYFSAGSWEDWRPDAGAFPAAVKGRSNGWSGERWLDIRRLDVLRPIMEARADLALAKGAQAIEWDNVDGYLNRTGFRLTKSDQLAFNRMLAQIAHERGLAAIQKNAPDLVPDLVGNFDAVLAEEAYRYREISAYQPYRDAGKAVWVAEYRSRDFNWADARSRGMFLGLYKVALDGPPVRYSLP
jgi:hypothetical protein